MAASTKEIPSIVEKGGETEAVEVVEEHIVPERAKEVVLGELSGPVLFKDMIFSWSEALSWTPGKLADLLSGVSTTFKICPRGTHTRGTLFENECMHVVATYHNLFEWLEVSVNKGKRKQKKTVISLSKEETDVLSSSKRAKTDEFRHGEDNPLLLFSPEEFWIYADYKYMSELCRGLPGVQKAVDWSVFGFEERDGQQSTLWVGSEGAYTPCHYDTYGCNLVAQLYGSKKWTLFPPSSSPCMYPTRLPFEESSVFSQVNITNPDVTRHPKFVDAHKYEVLLEPGQVLLVPRHWWHYVECTTAAVSVNTWIELPQDDEERIKEALTRLLVCALKGVEAIDLNAGLVSGGDTTKWLNPGEEVFSHSTNLKLVVMAMEAGQRGNSPKDDMQTASLSSLNEEQQNDLLINSVTDKRVVDLIAQVVKEKLAKLD